MLIKGLQLAIAEPKTLTLLKFGFVSLCLFAEASLITEMFWAFWEIYFTFKMLWFFETPYNAVL
jgi:hypothetical protein